MPMAVSSKLLSLLGCDRPTLDATLDALGWQRVDVAAKDEASPPIAVWRRSRSMVAGAATARSIALRTKNRALRLSPASPA